MRDQTVNLPLHTPALHKGTSTEPCGTPVERLQGAHVDLQVGSVVTLIAGLVRLVTDHAEGVSSGKKLKHSSGKTSWMETTVRSVRHLCWIHDDRNLPLLYILSAQTFSHLNIKPLTHVYLQPLNSWTQNALRFRTCLVRPTFHRLSESETHFSEILMKLRTDIYSPLLNIFHRKRTK